MNPDIRHDAAITPIAPTPLAGSHVVVIGAGLMGVGIAQVFAVAGASVRLVEVDPGCRETAPQRMAGQLGLMVREGLLDADAAEVAAARVILVSDLGEALAPPAEDQPGTPSAAQDPTLGPPDMVIEAIGEDLDLKRSLFAELDAVIPPSTLLCTNTSGLSISAIAGGLRHPERVCGAHFWNPPHLIPLVEVVRGAETSDATVASATRMLTAAGKVPVEVRKDVPGFIGNRLQHALQREAMALVSSGVASAEDVDLVVTQGFGRRLGVVGPLAICDMAGLDLILQVDSYLIRDLERSPDPDPLLASLVEQGDVGVRSLKGFLSWTPDSVEAAIDRRDKSLIKALRNEAASAAGG